MTRKVILWYASLPERALRIRAISKLHSWRRRRRAAEQKRKQQLAKTEEKSILGIGALPFGDAAHRERVHDTLQRRIA